MDTNFLPWVFGAITLVGVLYFLYNIFLGGGLGEAGDLGGDLGELGGTENGGQIGCTVIAAFLAGFGSIGLLGSLSGWSLLVTLGVALVFGLVIGRVVIAVLRFVARQQSTSVTSDEDLIGAIARITIDSPEGTVGEAMIEGEYVTKYPVRETSGAALKRGDSVEIVDVSGGVLYVKRKRA